MCNRLRDGFVKGNSNNLPLMTECMVTQYIVGDKRFNLTEMAGWELLIRSAQPSYRDIAISYVQVKKDKNTFCAQAYVTPEHRVHNTPYKVIVDINLNTSEVISSKCFGCAASNGGCKHSMTFLYWLHRRSAEPSPTQVECYWKKSVLSQVTNGIPFIRAKNIALPKEKAARKRKCFDRGETGSFLRKFIADSPCELKRSSNSPEMILKYFSDPEELDGLDIHRLARSFRVYTYIVVIILF